MKALRAKCERLGANQCHGGTVLTSKSVETAVFSLFEGKK